MSKRGPRIAEGLEEAAADLFAQGLGVAAVRRELKSREEDFPTERTWWAWRRKYSPKNLEPWIVPANERGGFALEAFAAARTAGYAKTSVLTKSIGSALVRVHRLAPNVPPLAAWHFAVEISKGAGLAPVDASLGFARLVKVVWMGSAGIEDLGLDGPDTPRPSVRAHVDLHSQIWPDRPLLAWAGGGSTLTSYLLEMGYSPYPQEDPRADPDTLKWGAENPAVYDTETWFIKGYVRPQQQEGEQR